jgi:hypothetical protein
MTQQTDVAEAIQAVQDAMAIVDEALTAIDVMAAELDSRIGAFYRSEQSCGPDCGPTCDTQSS